jgi:hypothetical protein
MNHKITIPENYPNARRIAEALDIALPFINAECVYSTHDWELLNSPILLTIIVDPKYDERYSVDYRIAEIVFKDIPDLLYSIYTTDAVDNNLEMGNLFFLRLFNESTLLYSREGSGFHNDKSQLDLKKNYSFAQMEYSWMIERVGELLDTTQYCINKEWLQLSAFNLYQAIYILFLFCEELYTGKEQSERFLMGRQEFLKGFAPDLFKLFNPKSTLHMNFVDRLEQSARRFYHLEVFFEQTEINKLLHRTNELYQKIHILFEGYLQHEL